jgi:hypothetical protein
MANCKALPPNASDVTPVRRCPAIVAKPVLDEIQLAEGQFRYTPDESAAAAPGTGRQRMYARASNGSPQAGGEYSAAYRGGRNVGAGEDFPLVAGSPICDVEFVLIHATG